MNFQSFMNKYMGVAVDFDEAYGAQYIGIIRQYFKDVRNEAHIKKLTGMGG